MREKCNSDILLMCLGLLPLEFHEVKGKVTSTLCLLLLRILIFRISKICKVSYKIGKKLVSCPGNCISYNRETKTHRKTLKGRFLRRIYPNDCDIFKHFLHSFAFCR